MLSVRFVLSHPHLSRMKSSTFAAAAICATASASLYGESVYNHTCVLDPQLESCSAKATPTNVDTCCVETYGGLLLQTQFWTIYTGLEKEGQLLPTDSWGIHGLWPDFW